MAHRVADGLRIGQSLTLWEEDLDGKLIAVGIGEESYLQSGDNQAGQQDQGHATEDRYPRTMEGELEHTVVSALHPFRDGITIGLDRSWLDDACLKERNDAHSQCQ